MMPRALRMLAAAILLAAACVRSDPAAWLGTPQEIAEGVDLFKTTDETLLDPAAPIAIYLMRLDLDEIEIEVALADGMVMGAETVGSIAKRRGALAGVNGGFFNLKNGEPVGLLKVAGEIVSDTSLTRGVVAIQSPPGERQELDFDQVSVKLEASFGMGAQPAVVAIDGVDTTRERGKLMLFTPLYHPHTDTAGNGTEWVLSGSPLRVALVRRDLGRTPIPEDGVVLSYGGLDPPSPLDWLAPGVEVTLKRNWTVRNETPAERFETARHIVNGAGLLRRDGRTLSDQQAVESLQAATFMDVRHPRTLIGTDRRGNVWLIAIDGRQPNYSVGMTFAELESLCERLGLVNALNLDGGGSTSMVVGGEVVNKPSDANGARPVSDAILIRSRVP